MPQTDLAAPRTQGRELCASRSTKGARSWIVFLARIDRRVPAVSVRLLIYAERSWANLSVGSFVRRCPRVAGHAARHLRPRGMPISLNGWWASCLARAVIVRVTPAVVASASECGADGQSRSNDTGAATATIAAANANAIDAKRSFFVIIYTFSSIFSAFGRPTSISPNGNTTRSLICEAARNLLARHGIWKRLRMAGSA